MKAIAIIPARYKSTRYPGKPLVEILGVPLVIHVARKAEAALTNEHVYIATDDERIANVAQKYGYKFVMTSSDALTGTDRLWEVAQQIPADIYVNIQGDEPMINPDDILRVIEEKKKHSDKVINCMCVIGADEDPASVNLPKVVFSKNNYLIYMSRLAVPGNKTGKVNPEVSYYKQVCIYGFSYNELAAYGHEVSKARYEQQEDIEILRFFDLGIGIKMLEVDTASLAVDIPEDVEKVTEALKSVR